MNLSNFYCVVSKVVVNDEWTTVVLCEESQHLSVVIQELLL